jgi:hypothetical protein
MTTTTRFIVVVVGKRIGDIRYVVIDTTCNRRSWWGDPVRAQAEAARRNAA